MPQPLLSVIITTYKRPAEILRRAVTSVLEQDYSNIELIVVNDYPEDKALVEDIREMLHAFEDERLSYLVPEANGGACRARNLGIQRAAGEFVAFLDDDDAWMPDKLSRQMAAFSSDAVGAVSCDYLDIGRNKGKAAPVVVRTGPKKGRSLIEALLWSNCVGGCSEPLIRASVFERVGTFDESLPASQDYDLWMRIAKEFEFAFVHEPLVKRYYSEDAITGNFDKKMAGFEIFQKKNAYLYQRYPDALNYRYAQKSHFCLMHKHFKQGLRFFIKACRVKLLSKYNITELLKGMIKFFFR